MDSYSKVVLFRIYCTLLSNENWYCNVVLRIFYLWPFKHLFNYGHLVFVDLFTHSMSLRAFLVTRTRVSKLSSSWSPRRESLSSDNHSSVSEQTKLSSDYGLFYSINPLATKIILVWAHLLQIKILISAGIQDNLFLFQISL